MYAVFGKSLKKEELRKGLISNRTSLLERFNSNKNAYQISPNYSCKERCLEFVELAKTNKEVRCLYIARLEKSIINGEPKLSKKTGKPLFKFVKLQTI